MRSIWKGTLGFGMVSIPVKLYGSVSKKSETSLATLHSECGSRIKMPKYCPQCDRMLEAGELAKAYEISKDQYVPLTEDELAGLPLPSLQAVSIQHFIKEDDLPDERWYKDSYFIAPEKAGQKAFVLFMKAMEQTGMVGVAKIAIRGREHLCVVEPFDGVLLMETLYWADEIREPDELRVTASVSEKEMAMATSLIQAMSGEPQFESYKDEYKEALLKLVEAKVAGEIIETKPIAQKQEADLADALIESLKQAQPV